MGLLQDVANAWQVSVVLTAQVSVLSTAAVTVNAQVLILLPSHVSVKKVIEVQVVLTLTAQMRAAQVTVFVETTNVIVKHPSLAPHAH